MLWDISWKNVNLLLASIPSYEKADKEGKPEGQKETPKVEVKINGDELDEDSLNSMLGI